MTPTRFAAGVVIVLAFVGLLVIAEWTVNRLVQLLTGVAPC